MSNFSASICDLPFILLSGLRNYLAFWTNRMPAIFNQNSIHLKMLAGKVIQKFLHNPCSVIRLFPHVLHEIIARSLSLSLAVSLFPSYQALSSSFCLKPSHARTLCFPSHLSECISAQFHFFTIIAPSVSLSVFSCRCNSSFLHNFHGRLSSTRWCSGRCSLPTTWTTLAWPRRGHLGRRSTDRETETQPQIAPLLLPAPQLHNQHSETGANKAEQLSTMPQPSPPADLSSCTFDLPSSTASLGKYQTDSDFKFLSMGVHRWL